MRFELEGMIVARIESNDNHLSAQRVLSHSHALSLECASDWLMVWVNTIAAFERRQVSMTFAGIYILFYFQYCHEYKRKSQTVRRKQLIPLISIDSMRMFSCIRGAVFIITYSFKTPARFSLLFSCFMGALFIIFSSLFLLCMRHSCWPTILDGYHCVPRVFVYFIGIFTINRNNTTTVAAAR